MSNKSLTYGLIAVAIVAIIGLFNPSAKGTVLGAIGSATNFYSIVLDSSLTAVGITNTGTITQGSSGNAVTQYNFGKCAIWANAQTIAASTTKNVDCSSTGRAGGTLTGITSTSNVIVTATSSLSSTYLGVRILSARASTTAGYITLSLKNLTGTTFTWSGTSSSTIAYQAVK